VLDQTPYSRSKRLVGVRILLVEDNTDCLNALRVLLAKPPSQPTAPPLPLAPE